MIVKQFVPDHPFVKSIIELYQYVQTETEIEVKTIPNGRVDGWILLKGSFKIFNEEKNALQKANQTGFFPITQRTTSGTISKGCICINIKFFPHILNFPQFLNKQLVINEVAFGDIFIKNDTNILIEKIEDETELKQIIKALDNFFNYQFYKQYSPDDRIFKAMQLIEKENYTQLSIIELSQKVFLSVKTLERQFKKYVGLSPKQYYNVVRLQKVFRQRMMKIDHQSSIKNYITDDYYDQSHFNKECKRITGLTPKQLFPKIKYPFTDLIIQ